MTSKKPLRSPASAFWNRRQDLALSRRKPARSRKLVRTRRKRPRMKVRGRRRNRWLKLLICGLKTRLQNSCDNGAFASGGNGILSCEGQTSRYLNCSGRDRYLIRSSSKIKFFEVSNFDHGVRRRKAHSARSHHPDSLVSVRSEFVTL